MLADMLLHCVACVWLRLGSCKVQVGGNVAKLFLKVNT